ncbi:pentapeptide repeat-containing protein [Eubacterium aggregans]|uniref:pentapeptide repeat-containing protein n=1 Tax=Eubacterium aggregans TaxID=81409 RepID=UPI003F2D8FA8
MGDCAIKGVLESKQNFSELSVENARFENCRLLDCSFKKSSFKNVSFRNCDFSGSRFEDAYFSQCEWKGCKALGSIFSQGVFKNILLADKNMKYTDFDGSQWRWAHWEEVDFTWAFSTQSRLRDL